MKGRFVIRIKKMPINFELLNIAEDWRSLKLALNNCKKRVAGIYMQHCEKR